MSHSTIFRTAIPGIILLITACSNNDEPVSASPGPAIPAVDAAANVEQARLVSYSEEREACDNYTANRQALFGDVHVHTALSFDAAANSTGTYPEDAYRFARGENIPFFPVDENGTVTGQIKLAEPLDFLAVTDHAEFLGERRLCRDESSPRYNSDFCRDYRTSERHGMRLLGTVVTSETPARIEQLCGSDGNICREYASAPWQHIIESAEAAYDRSSECSFTSFVGYEYTGTPQLANYHHNVIFRNANVPALPVSYVEARYDHQLWQQLDAGCSAENNCDYLTIPHNSNLANGRMSPYLGMEASRDNKLAYAGKRLQREPVIEIFQHKGNSECFNGLAGILGEPDELCNFESVRTMGEVNIGTPISLRDGKLHVEKEEVVTEDCGDGIGRFGMRGAGCISRNDFLRSMLLTGLQEEKDIGLNPVKLGVIASTDTHLSTPGAVSEANWQGHVSKESTPEERLEPGYLTSGIVGNAGGLAGVWAVENSRDAIFDAFQRREVFGTSGPRIKPRLFAAWDFAEGMCDQANMIEQAYANGVPMGGDLPARANGQAPAFLLAAQRDPGVEGAPLQQLQLIKGWVDEQGESRYSVTTVAGDADNGASVDLETGERTGDGFSQLCTVYRDPDFNPLESAYYYLRVVENPSPRWSHLECLRLEEERRPAACTDPGVPKTIQEMAWTSPIWYQPQD